LTLLQTPILKIWPKNHFHKNRIYYFKISSSRSISMKNTEKHKCVNALQVLLHVATNYPDHLAMERLVTTGHSEHLALAPMMISAEMDLKSIAASSRGCYFYNEKTLTGFQQYSYKSCIFNCRVDFFLKLCKCLPFYYPTTAGRCSSVYTCKGLTWCYAFPYFSKICRVCCLANKYSNRAWASLFTYGGIFLFGKLHMGHSAKFIKHRNA